MPRWLLLLVVVIVGALAFTAGRIVAVGGENDAAGPNEADAGFARDMQVHHAQAVEMAMIEYRATDDEELRIIAYDIATAQQSQRGQMYGWLVEWGLPQAGDPLMTWMRGSGHDHGASPEADDDELREAMGMASDEDVARLAELDGPARDCLFVDLMIRHHSGAVEMVDAIADLGSVPHVLRTAASMKETQQAEIDALRSVSSRLGCG